jgi:hypothetical protein
MKPFPRRVALGLAVPGVVVCLLAVARFLFKISKGNLPWEPGQSFRDHALAVGRAFGDGFATGFFFCFFLMLAAIAIGTWFDQRQAQKVSAATGLIPRSTLQETGPRTDPTEALPQ